MSSFEPAERTLLIVEAADLATELFVLDGQLREVGRGLGRLEIHLEPGIYKVKARADYVVKEQRVVVTANRFDSVRFPPLEFATAAPLDHTTHVHVEQIGAAMRESGRTHKTAGKGSSVFVFAHGSYGDSPLAEGLALREAGEERELVASIDSGSASRLGEAAWTACNIELTPAVYCLTLRMRDGRSLEQTLVASPGWQTQVFVGQQPDEASARRWHGDLAGASILMARKELPQVSQSRASFSPSDPRSRLIELARRGLANGRVVLADDVLREILDGDFEDPMLGLLGAHALLHQVRAADRQGADPDFPMANVESSLRMRYGGGVSLGTIVEKLRRLVGIGVHPDVEALGLLLEPNGGYRFAYPPMLRESWGLIINASVVHPELIPLGSLSERIADRLWCQGSWLLWTEPLNGMGQGVVEEPNEFEAALILRLRQLQSIERGDPLTPFRLLDRSSSERVAARAEHMAWLDRERPRMSEWTSSIAEMSRLVRALGLPRANIERIIEKITLM